jgi:ATP-dependent DNA helicase DinG
MGEPVRLLHARIAVRAQGHAGAEHARLHKSRRCGCTARDRSERRAREGSRTDLLERFRRVGNAVLVGSQSFWEGVDVRGEALSLVVIDKLPFAPPDDPLLAARIERINRDGRNAFVEFQLPQAVITLKQGAGRLIRDETDRGVLMICDPRLFSKGYGRRILRSLPSMKGTREAAEVIAFFERE